MSPTCGCKILGFGFPSGPQTDGRRPDPGAQKALVSLPVEKILSPPELLSCRPELAWGQKELLPSPKKLVPFKVE
jgi:hypothetical protein